jgi:hypothetical protein
LDEDLQENISIPKIDDLPLSAVVASQDNALGNALRRVIKEINEERVNFAAFGNLPIGWD